MNTPSFVIISGTSGSGKTIALQVLEDLGFYCIDNLPASLLPEMATRLDISSEQSNDKEAVHQDSKIAISIDSRNRDLSSDIEACFANLREQNIDFRILFLDAEDKILLKRYSETRRKHPLSDANTSLSEAIVKERSLLQYIANVAHRHIDTTETTPHELRSTIKSYAATSEHAELTLLFESFGFKHGSPTDADFVFDVRCLPNPHWHAELKPLTGLDTEVHDFLADQPMCIDMFQHIRDFIDHWLPSFINDNRNYMTVAIGCTGGQHRSVFISDLLSKYFSESDMIHTQVRHRELNL